MGFGKVTKYWKINLKDIESNFLGSNLSATVNDDEIISVWDNCIESASSKYDQENHNLISNNCHSHVATALNICNFKRITYWNTFLLIIYMAIYGKYVRYNIF